MRHRHDGRKLGITASHRKAMLSNMVTSLFATERIETTVPKAKEARRLAERLITFARRGNAAGADGHEERRLAARRHIARTVHDSEILRKLFNEIAPRFADRPGGYTRILRLGSVRVGDAARRAILELVKKDEEKRKKKKTPRKTYHKVEMAAAPPANVRPAPAPAEGEAAESAQPPAGAGEEAAAAAEAKAEVAEAASGKTGTAGKAHPAAGAAHAKGHGAGPAHGKAAKAEEAAAPKKEKAHKAEAEKASGGAKGEAAKPHRDEAEKKAKAKPADTKGKGKKE